MTTETLTFVLNWIDVFEGEPVQTMARYSVQVGGMTVWPVWGDPAANLEIYADDLLSHLTEFWQPLLLRQHYPLPVSVDRPSQFRPEIESSWGGLPEAQAIIQADAVAAFEEAHNLALAFGGQFNLPALWLFRQGEYLLLESGSRLIKIAIGSAMAALTSVGDKIAERFVTTGQHKWERLVRNWRERDRRDPDMALAWSSGLSQLEANHLVKAGILQPVSSVTDAANDDDPIRIAARMTGALPIAEIARLLDRASRISARPSQLLDELSREAIGTLSAMVGEPQPFEQGVAVARMVRAFLGIGSFARMDPLRQIFDAAHIYVAFEELGLANLDAIAIWGRQHGPGVLINVSSKRLRPTSRADVAGQGAARVTLAHELCHLLIDRGRALGAVDILAGRMPLPVEQRARAFAAELMLPSEAAARAWADTRPEITTDGVRSILKSLTQRFGVTASIAAWQLEHGLRDQVANLSFLLDQIVPSR